MEQLPPSIDELTARFLARSAEESPVFGEVEAYDAVPAQAVDPRSAWTEALAALGDVDAKSLGKLPGCWATLLANLDSQTGTTMAAGNFPQAVRDWLPLVQNADLSRTLGATGPTADVAGLSEWIATLTRTGEPTRLILAAGILRLARCYDEAAELLSRVSGTTADNERAALAWHRGDHATARQLWSEMPESTPVLFNRGMAALFQGDIPAARRDLKAAADQLSDATGWHHLARLYQALAESRTV